MITPIPILTPSLRELAVARGWIVIKPPEPPRMERSRTEAAKRMASYRQRNYALGLTCDGRPRKRPYRRIVAETVEEKRRIQAERERPLKPFVYSTSESARKSAAYRARNYARGLTWNGKPRTRPYRRLVANTWEERRRIMQQRKMECPSMRERKK